MFSGGELYSSETGDETLLAYQKSGLALAAGEGPLEAPPSRLSRRSCS